MVQLSGVHCIQKWIFVCLCVCVCVSLLPTGAQTAGPNGLIFGMAMDHGTVCGWLETGPTLQWTWPRTQTAGPNGLKFGIG